MDSRDDAADDIEDDRSGQGYQDSKKREESRDRIEDVGVRQALDDCSSEVGAIAKVVEEVDASRGDDIRHLLEVPPEAGGGFAPAVCTDAVDVAVGTDAQLERSRTVDLKEAVGGECKRDQSGSLEHARLKRHSLESPRDRRRDAVRSCVNQCVSQAPTGLYSSYD